MVLLTSPVALPDEVQLRQTNLIALILLLVLCVSLMIVVIGVLSCLFFCFRQKSYFISKKKKTVKHEVAASATQSSRDVAAVQKYLLRTAAHSRPAVSLAAVSSTVPLGTSARVTRKPESLQRVRFTAADQSRHAEERAVLKPEEGDEQAHLDDRPPCPPSYNYPAEDVGEEVRQERSDSSITLPPPPAYHYPTHDLD